MGGILRLLIDPAPVPLPLCGLARDERTITLAAAGVGNSAHSPRACGRSREPSVTIGGGRAQHSERLSTPATQNFVALVALAVGKRRGWANRS
jgi:hypothetical protein